MLFTILKHLRLIAISKLRWFAILGVVIFGAMLASEFVLQSKAVTVKGVYLGYETAVGREGGLAILRQVFRYTDTQGIAHTSKTKFSSDEALIPGQTVLLLMNPEDPSWIRLKSKFNPFLTIGPFWLGSVLVLVILHWSKKPKRPKVKGERPMAKLQSKKLGKQDQPTVRRLRKWR